MKKNNGCFWHIHHDVLCEWTDDIQERIAYIRKEKPANEIKTRLKLMKPVKGELPDKFVKALKVFNIAQKAYHKTFTWEAHNKAREARNKAWEAYDKRQEALDKTWKALNKTWKARNKTWEAFDKRQEAYDKAREAYNKAWEAFRPQLEALHKKECGCKEWNGTEMIFKKGE